MKINNPKMNIKTDYTVVIECTLHISAELGNLVLERFLLTVHRQTDNTVVHFILLRVFITS